MEERIIKKIHNTEIEILNEIDRICKENEIRYFLIGGTLLGAVRHKGFIPWDDDLDIAMPREDYDKFTKIANKELSEKYIFDSIKNNKLYWLPFAKIRIKNTILEEKVMKSYKGNKGIWVDIFPLDNAKNQVSLVQTLKYKGIVILRYIISQKMDILENKTILKKVINKLSKIFPIYFLTGLVEKIMMSNFNKKSDYFINYGSQYGIKKQTHLKSKYLPAIDIEFEGKMYKAPNDCNYVLTKIYGDNYMQLPPVEKRVTHNPIRIKFEDGEEIKFEE